MKKLLLLLLLIFSASGAFAQGGNRVQSDYNRFVHFGISIGTNFSNFKYDRSDSFYTFAPDTFRTINMLTYPGFTLGGIVDFHLGGTRTYLREHFDLRLIPSIVLTTRRISYISATGRNPVKEIESALLELPVLVKFKSIRWQQNTRFYVIGGFKYSYDLSSNKDAVRNILDPQVVVSPHNYSYELGTGLDLYFPYFKFSPEIKISRGINNLLVPDPNKPAPYSDVYSRLRSNFLFISLNFEG